jgi:hypothetical protein
VLVSPDLTFCDHGKLAFRINPEAVTGAAMITVSSDLLMRHSAAEARVTAPLLICEGKKWTEILVKSR